MRHARSFLAALILSTAALAADAGATTFADVTVEELAAASDLIVVGRVVDVVVEPHGPAGLPGIHTTARVHVEEVLLGESPSDLEVVVHGGRHGGLVRLVPGQAGFVHGERVALFLFRAHGALWPTGMGRGKWVIDEVTDEARPSVGPPGSDAHSILDETGAPLMSAGRNVDELRELVRHVCREARARGCR